MLTRRIVRWTLALLTLSATVACSPEPGPSQEPKDGSAGSLGGQDGQSDQGSLEGQGGQGGVGAIDLAGIGTLGEPCAPEGALACEGHAQRAQLRCTDGKWSSNGTCASDSFCDTSGANRGLCRPALPECLDQEPGEVVCLDDDRVACGADLVNTTLVESCYGCRLEGCYCPAGTITADGVGLERCQPCPAGTYSSTEGATTCVACERGTVSLDASSSGCAPSQIAAGAGHTCALLTDGNVRCWGRGSYGQLGYGNNDNVGDTSTPASVGDVDVGGTVAQIAAGAEHTCALLTDGNVRCWGWGDSGRLGYGNTDTIGFSNTPASAGNVDVGGTVAQLAAGAKHTCALLTNGNVRCWGSGDDGRLGYGNTDNVGDTNTPADAGNVDVGGTVAQIAAGDRHTCALLKAGNVRCWGWGDHGRLGYGSTDDVGDTNTPADAGDVDVGGAVAQITTGAFHTCALLTDGNVRCWGRGGSGRLGYGNTDNVGDTNTPADAGNVDVGGTVAQIATGGFHTCALLTSGNARCWGWGGYGQLGYGSTDNVGDTNTPADAGNIDVGGMITQIMTGSVHTCTLLTDGNVRCWGWGDSGRLGYGNTDNVGDTNTPAAAGNVSYL